MERSAGVWHTWYCGSRDRGRTWVEPLCVSRRMPRGTGAAADGFQISSDDDQSSVRDDGRGRVHLTWSVRGGTIAHAIVEWSPADTAPEKDD
jgi:hypothetical protein